MPIPRLRRDSTALLVIDVQERLLPTIAHGEDVAVNCGILLDVADALGLPSLVTEQYVRGLGRTVPGLRERIRPTTPVVEKTRFSAVVPEVTAFLDRHRIGNVLVCGGRDFHIHIRIPVESNGKRGNSIQFAFHSDGSLMQLYNSFRHRQSNARSFDSSCGCCRIILPKPFKYMFDLGFINAYPQVVD